MSRDRAFAAGTAAKALVFVDGVHDDGDRWLEGQDGHHLARVRRLRPGGRVVIADGAGSWRLSVVAESTAGRLRLAPCGEVTEEPELTPALAIAFAPAKADHAAAVVHQLVELGVDRIVPVGTRRSVVRWEGERGARTTERLERVAREAAMQAHRARLPVIAAPGRFGDLTEHPALVVADRDGMSAGELPLRREGEWLVVVGPEGGLDRSELDEITPHARMAIGPHVVRAATAPVAAAAALAGLRR